MLAINHETKCDYTDLKYRVITALVQLVCRLNVVVESTKQTKKD